MFITVTHNRTTSKGSACRVICTRTSENGSMAGAELRQKIFTRGLSFRNLPKLHWFVMFHISIWGAWRIVWGELSPPNPVSMGLGGGIGPSALSTRWATGAEVPFHKSIIGSFMVCQDRLETNLLQLFGHPENSEWFSIISAIIFEINIVDEQKQT